MVHHTTAHTAGLDRDAIPRTQAHLYPRLPRPYHHAMASIAVDLPEETARWAQSVVDRGEAPSVAAYLAELMRREHEEAEDLAGLQAAIDQGIASGIDPRPPHQIFADVRRKYFTQDG